MNPRHEEVCQHCGADLHPQRQQQVEVSGTPLVEAFDVPVDDNDLRFMTHRDRLRWCAGDDGRLLRERLERVARVKNYEPGWVYYTMRAGHWQAAWKATKAWRKRL